MLIPILNSVFGLPIDVAVGTGLCITPGTGVAALRRHIRLRQGEVKVDWIMLGGALLGVSAGARTVSYLSHLGSIDVWGRELPAARFWISGAYIVVLTAAAVFMIRGTLPDALSDVPHPGPISRAPVPPYTYLPNIRRSISIPVLALLGLSLGFLSGLMGLGGGVILLPLLVYGIGMPMRMAAGTGIVLLVASALAGTLNHALAGHVHLGIAMVLLSGSTIGAPIGATLTSRTSGDRLRKVFGILLAITVLTVVWNLVRSNSP